MGRNALKNKIHIQLAKLLPYFSLLIKKNSNLWVFGAWQGQLYADNAKYLFEYVTKNHPEIKCIWITKNDYVLKELKEKGQKCYKSYSIRGIFAVLRAGAAFETEGDGDLSFFLNKKKTITIQLWHGMPIKAMRWSNQDGSSKMKSKNYYNLLYWASTSDLYTQYINKLLGVELNRFRITGYPRNDALLSNAKNQEVLNILSHYKAKFYFIYMPTHRNFGKDGNKHINIESFSRLDNELKILDAVMVYKPHFHELQHFSDVENKFKNIIFAKDQNVWADVYSYLNIFDALVSDYSSVITDFMCTGKPVIYFPYDEEQYKTGDAGLCDCYYSIPGGPKCYSWDAVIDQIKLLLKEDNWKQIREECRIQYHLYNDGLNSERVYKFTKDLLSRKLSI